MIKLIQMDKLTQDQYNNLVSEEEITRQILRQTLRYHYTDIEVVNQVSDFCSQLYKMEHLEVRGLKGFLLEVVCYRTVDGYDNQIIKFYII